MKKYVTGLISREQFEMSFTPKADYSSYDMLLETALNDFQEFNMLFWYLPTKIDDKEKDKIFKKYISIVSGHQEHEEMLNYFHQNFIEPEKNVLLLTSLVTNPPKYFEEAGREKVFQEKCLFTIAKQPTTKAKKVLEEFSLSDDDTISRASKFYLEKLAKNVQ